MDYAPERVYLSIAENENKYSLSLAPVEGSINVEYIKVSREDKRLYDIIHEEVKKRIVQTDLLSVREAVNEILNKYEKDEL